MHSAQPWPAANLLTLNRSAQKVAVWYDANAHPFMLPLIGPRPPYYRDPRYEPYYPVI